MVLLVPDRHSIVVSFAREGNRIAEMVILSWKLMGWENMESREDNTYDFFVIAKLEVILDNVVFVPRERNGVRVSVKRQQTYTILSLLSQVPRTPSQGITEHLMGLRRMTGIKRRNNALLDLVSVQVTFLNLGKVPCYDERSS